MGIKLKTIIIILLSFLILILNEYFIIRAFFMSNVLSQEKIAVKEECKRAGYIISQNLFNLETTVKDYAIWDDTLNYIKTMDSKYLDTNFANDSINNLKLNVVIFFDKARSIKNMILYDPDINQKVEITPQEKAFFIDNKDSICNIDNNKVNSGITKIGSKCLFYTITPITDSKASVKGNGYLLFGRFIDSNILGDVEEITNAKIKIYEAGTSFKDEKEKFFFNYIREDLFKSEAEYISPFDNKNIRAYYVLRDIKKEPLFILQMDINRDIYNNGKRSIYFFEIMSVAVIMIITIVLILLIQRIVVHPIVNLSNNLGKMDVNNIYFKKPDTKSTDEIAKLYNEIDKMLLKIKDKSEVEKELTYLSYYDKLTGVFNRGYFEYIIDRKLKYEDFPLTIIIGDINGLKITNDTFGHNSGDKLIASIAEILKSSVKEKDIVSRWGGDEFAIILKNSSDAEAEEFCTKVREKCNQQKSGPVALNISLGYSNIENFDVDFQEAIKEAEERMYRNKLFENKSARNSIISSLKRTLVERSNETEEHTSRIYEKCQKLGRKMNLSKAKLDELSLLAVLHDIGKIAIPDYILNKKGGLTEEEWRIMKTHTEIGYRIAAATHELSHISYAILTHHENFDGSGYPKGIKGTEIPLISRIISILDAYDVMTHDRPYKKSITVEAALEELRRCRGTQFDPEIVDICIEVLKEDMPKSYTVTQI